MSELAGAPMRQINLYNPALLPTREVFSARLIVTWVIIAALAMAAVGWWALMEKRNVGREVAKQLSQQAADIARSTATTPGGEALPTPQQVAAREQALRAQQALLEARRGVRDLLRRGVAGEKSGPKALLRVLATTVPAEIWLTEVRVEGSQLNISGKTLEPSAVNVWLDRLLVTGYLADKVPPSMRVERIDTIVPVSSAVPLTYSFNILTSLAAPFADGGAKP